MHLKTQNGRGMLKRIVQGGDAMNIPLSELWELTDGANRPCMPQENLPEFGEVYEIVLLMAFAQPCLIFYGEGKYELEAGDICIWDRFTKRETQDGMCGDGPLYRPAKEDWETCRALCLHIPAAILAQMCGRDVVQAEATRISRTHSLWGGLKDLMLRALMDVLEANRQEKSEHRALPQLYAWILDHCLISDKKMAKTCEERLDYIRRYVHSGYNRRLGLEHLASQMGLSVPYLSKFIKEHLGQNFHSYVDMVRPSYTRGEFEKNGGIFSSAALKCGFPNSMAFNRTFERIYHTAPAAYKRERRPRGRVPLDLNVCRWLRGIVDDLRSGDSSMAARGKICVTAAAQTGRPYQKNWLKVLNLGYAEDLQKDSIQEHILRLKKELGFIYGRVENIFSQRLYVDIHSSSRFNFSRVDMILDFLTQHGIIPFLNMSFTDKIIRKDVKSLFMKEDIVKEFADDAQYSRLIEEFFSHCVRRYGASAVEKWRIELRWIHKIGEEMNERWLDIFGILYRIVKKYSPGTFVGGFCFNVNGDWGVLEQYLKSGKGVRPDFISVVCYPYCCPEDIKGAEHSPLVRDMGYMGKKLDELNILLEQNGWDRRRLYISEWNISISNNNYLHDSCWKAAYILQTAGESMEKAWCMAHWGCSDRTMEYYDSVRLLNGRNGLLSRNGIGKPSYYAYEFLNRMGDGLIAKNQRYILSEDGEGNYYFVCNNLRPIRDFYYEQPDERVDCVWVKELFEDIRIGFCLNLTSVCEQRYRVEILSVSTEGGSVMDEWLRLGHEDESSDMECSWLASVCVPHYRRSITGAKDGCLHVETELAANEIQFLRISPHRVSSGENNGQ